MIKLDSKRIAILLVYIIASGLTGYYLPDAISFSDTSLQIIPSTFATVLGFLITAIVLMGETEDYEERSWRYFHIRYGELQKRLYRYSLIIITLLFAVAACAVFSMIDKGIKNLHVDFYRNFERILAGYCAFAFLVCLTIPSSFMRILSERYQFIIDSKKGMALKSK